ncbi:RES family NAD+ phosphorylase [uncultured Deefgea sp.]|uniref:RES family NAD+ phosphorylase n=1 Tax=uncultured Deefgea sp. TaxID=1304914 RepID=UPI002618ECBC|nr:RES family NAD+ phosphorylase [uncultured Deefgea sp.]
MSFLSTSEGCCDFCGSAQFPLLDPVLLREQFELLAGIYIRDDNGRTLVEWMQEDWLIFNSTALNSHQMRALLSEILDDGEIVRQKFVPQSNGDIDVSERWQEFRLELMHANRYFPESAIDMMDLKELLEHLVIKSENAPQEWFRGRICLDNPFTQQQMSSPPKHLASHGRANPAGIPYLYMASTEQTAVSEIRPHTGEAVTIAKASLRGDLIFADLRNPRKTISPFLIGDEEKIKKTRNFIGFLELLGRELTRPVLPRSAAFDYAPSQYLCEFIKKCNYSGVIYSSSVGDGFNLALFDPSLADINNVYQKLVSRVSVIIE